MKISDQEKNLMDKYNLGWFYSGGGCHHFSHDLKLTDETLWLINDLYEMPKGEFDCSQRFPTDENQLCMFGLYYGDLDRDLAKSIQTVIATELPNLPKHKKTETTFYEDGFYFYDTLKNGVPKMFTLTNEIEKLRDMGKVKNLIDDLGWDYQRMSLGGQETYKKLCKSLGWEFES